MREVEFAIAVLETAVADIYKADQQTADVWEALRTLRAAGAEDWMIAAFWRGAGERPACRKGAGGHTAYQSTTGAINGICRCVGVERTYRKVDDLVVPGGS